MLINSKCINDQYEDFVLTPIQTRSPKISSWNSKRGQNLKTITPYNLFLFVDSSDQNV